jgi:hypothetical protein
MQGREIDFKDGKKRMLRYGVRQVGMIEHEFGDKPLATLLGMGAGYRFMSYAIWAGLQTKDGGPDYEETCDLMDRFIKKTGASYLDLLPIVSEALIDAGVLRRVNGNGDDRPNGEAEAGESPPSPNGGTSTSPTS